MKIRIDTPMARLTADLPEDQVKDLLRIALEYATGVSGSACQPADAIQPAEPAPKINFPEPPTKPQESPATTGNKGFLYIKCEACGTTKGFCAKTPITEHRCACGHLTALDNLKPLYVNCKCGAGFKYHTNITDNYASIDCIKCGAPVDMEYHDKKGIYETIGRKEN